MSRDGGDVTAGQIAELRASARGAFQLLGVLSFMGDPPVPAWALAEGHETLPSPLSSAAAAGREALRELAEPLVARGWTTSETDGYRIDPAAAAAARRSLPARRRGRLAAAAVGVLHRAFPGQVGRPEDADRCRALAPHVLAACRHPEGGGQATAEAAHLLARLGAFRRSEGALEEALDAYRRAREAADRGDPVEDAFRAVLADETASALAGLGREEEAGRTAVEALELAEAGLRPEEPRLPILLSNVATTFRELGRHDRACACFERALELVRASGGSAGRPLAVELQAGLADVRMAQGRRQEAALAAEGALATAEELWGSEHPQVARATWMLADALRGRGRPERVVELYRRSLEVEASLHGEHHPAVGQKALALGLHLEETGRTGPARAAYRRAREAFEAALGPDSSASAAARRHLERLDGGSASGGEGSGAPPAGP